MILHNKTNIYKKLSLTFLLISIFIAGIVFYLTFSWVTITITPQSEQFTATYALDILTDPQAPLKADAIHGMVFQETLEAQGTFTTSESSVVQQQATGKVTLINTGPFNQPLVATTRLLTNDGTLLRLQNSTSVPARGQIEVEVYADKEGTLENLDTSRLTIPGLSSAQQEIVYGQGFTPAQPGSKKVRMVSKEDIERAKADLTKRLEEKFTQSISQNQPGFRPRLARIITTTSKENYTTDKKEGALSDEFTLDLTATFDAILFDDAESYPKALDRLTSAVASSQELIDPDPDSITYHIENISQDRSEATIKFTTTARKLIGQDTRIFDKDRIIGKNKAEIEQIFEEYEGIKEVQVNFYPIWTRTAPALKDHINILINKQ